jgi:hypothetical protein
MVHDGDSVLITTDALARFAVGAIQRNSEITVGELFPFLVIEDDEDVIFPEWANESRVANAIEDDDLTIVEISI